MTFGFAPKAERELASAVEYYNELRADLGERLTHEVLATVMRLTEHPRSGPLVRGEVRRVVAKRR